jgi:hypothetical protein
MDRCFILQRAEMVTVGLGGMVRWGCREEAGTASDEMTGSENVKSAPEDAFVALASQHGYFLHPLEIFM